jgi:AcrR family transcriptional regulator
MARRRNAEATRAAILASAEERLRASGPGSLRLDDIAGDVGVSRQALLHHFGSRAGLLRAVVERAWLGLFTSLAGLAGASDQLEPRAFVDLVDEVARGQGNARLGAWLLLSGQGLPDGFFAGALDDLPGQLDPSGEIDDARYTLLLIGAALFGDAIFGERLRQIVGLPDGEGERAAFRAWLACKVGEPGTNSS